MPLSSGDKIGPYEIISPIGAGGMGEVYRARDTRPGRDVALKILPPEVANVVSRRQLFELEARAVGGVPREIAENVVYADWAPDGTQLAVVRQLGGGEVLEYPLGNRIYQTPGYIGMPKLSPRGDLVLRPESMCFGVMQPVASSSDSGTPSAWR